MTEEERAKADAAAGEKLDKILTCLDSLSGRMDAMEASDKARKDSEESEKKEREDKARKDAEETEAKRVAADKSRKDGEESEEEKKAREDKARKDAEEAEAKRREEDEKADRARKDSEAMQARIKDLEARLPKARTDSDYGAMADAQAKADDAYQAFGDSAPAPLNGETLSDYQRRLATGLKRHSTKWKDVDLYALPDAVADIARADVYADASAAALAPPDDLAPGQFMEVRKRNPLTGGNIVEFRGKGTFIGSMKRPSRQVISIKARNAVN
jgi:colicin import membrane protein